jgi:hypothetical protein
MARSPEEKFLAFARRVDGAIGATRTEARSLQRLLERGAGARELALAQTKLEEAQMWLERAVQAAERVSEP